MPPKKQIGPSGKTCTSKDPRQLQDYANDPSISRNFLAHMLADFGFLEKFKLYPNFNECEYSFESGNWYAVHVTDEQGNQFFYDRNGAVSKGICYFQIENRNEVWGIVPESITFEKPPELEGLRQCQIKTNGKCGVPEKAKAKAVRSPASSASSTPQATPVPKPRAVVPPPRPVNLPPEITDDVVKSLELTFPTAVEGVSAVAAISGPKKQISRDEAEKMDKATLIAWMAKNMYPEDILMCLRTGALSSQDRKKLEEVEAELPSDVAPMSQADLQAINIAAGLAPDIARKMYKRVTKEELSSQIRGLSGLAKLEGIAELCRRSGKSVNVGKKAGRKPGTFVDALLEGRYSKELDKVVYTPVDGDVIDELLDDCAEREAIRLQNLLRRRFTSVMPMVARAQQRGKIPAFQPPVQAPAPPATNSFEQRVTAALAMPDSQEKGQALVLLSNEAGLDYSFKVVKSGKLVIYDDDGNPMGNAAIKAALLESRTQGFGRRIKRCKPVTKSAKHPLKVKLKNFKCAVKTCRKSNDYKKCMKTTLRKIYKKRTTAAFGKKRAPKSQIVRFKIAAKQCKGKEYRTCFRKVLKKMKPKTKPKKIKIKSLTKSKSKRKCPRVSATNYKVGTVRKGIDGKKWIVKRLKNKIKRWVKS